MARTYSYDPSKYSENGHDRMRMELGDTVVDGGADSCALCDEEYDALIKNYYTDGGQSWSYTQFKCLEAIYMRMSYEVDFKLGPASYNMQQRADRWKEMYTERRSAFTVPVVSDGALGKGRVDGGHYFRNGMQSNKRALFDPTHWPRG